MRTILPLMLAAGAVVLGFWAPAMTVQAEDSAQVVFYVA